MIKVIIADDHQIVREGLKCLIEQDKEISVVAYAKNGLEAFNLCQLHNPDIVLMDIVMPLYDGFTGIKMIKEQFKLIKILILTIFSDDIKITQAINAGADGYILKDITSAEITHVINCTVNGLTVMDKNAFNILKNQCISNRNNELTENQVLNVNLTVQEQKIIQLIVYGKSNKDIASAIFLSEGRVRNIITTIYKKFELQDRVQLAVYAVKNNLV